jgi:RNA polymerase sigma-70 factor (sigma-E family)
MEKKGRDAAFHSFFEAESTNLLRFATFMCGNPDLAADITQEALVRAYKRWVLIRTEEAAAYVRRAIVNLVRDRHRRTVVGISKSPSHATPSSEQSRAAQVDDWMVVMDALRRLSPMRRAAVVLRFYEDMSEHEIAETLNRPLGTVKSDLHRALRELRVLMEPREVAMEEGR